MTIDVLIPATRSDLINRCLASLANQQRKSDKVIVVIQHSHKRLQKTIDNFRQTFPLNIEMVYVGKPGAIEAINAGIKAASSDILCFIDDDARARPDWLKLIEDYYKDKKIGGVGGRDIIHCGSTILGKRVSKIGQIAWYGKLIGNHHNIADHAREVIFLKGCNMSFRRGLISSIDDNLKAKKDMAEPSWEVDIALKVKKKGYKIWYDPEIAVDHYPTTKEYHIDRRAFISTRNETYLLLKYLPPPGKIIFVFYSFLIGNRENPGLFIFLLEAMSKKLKDIKTLMRKFFYKIKGISLYLFKG